ncbi:hypothetical protein Y032_0563g3506 [Ancylostoma ceylanicum]|uniref:Uncharacterized protein n=1 Tax=Ancylostoma ceylanicum TaxID=53326 RepID=A0A016WQQ3_9BILA|nr:hypothetical protein Y032_0563g3506 [Ancylostoma ceylanicum]
MSFCKTNCAFQTLTYKQRGTELGNKSRCEQYRCASARCRAPMLRGATPPLIAVTSTTEQVRRECMYRTRIAPELWWKLQYSGVVEGCA